MKNVCRHMRKQGGITFLTLVTVAAWMAPPLTVVATDMMIATVKVTHWQVKSQAIPVPDEEGHIIAVGAREGTAVFDNGDVASYSNTTMADGWIGRKGVYRGYTRMVFEDGSKIFFSWEATAQRDRDGKSVTEGTGTITKGTTRFEGIDGRVIFRTTPLTSPSEDPKRTAVSQAVIVYNLPRDPRS
ncbi:MAG TPA: hypothetical protein PLA74_03475 [Syntrophales bacterium]|nr:hypothetical protein [Syntrophales bacterium]HPQ44523.1 hypothetical protein [Syntrophales bacterium]